MFDADLRITWEIVTAAPGGLTFSISVPDARGPVDADEAMQAWASGLSIDVRSLPSTIAAVTKPAREQILLVAGPGGACGAGIFTAAKSGHLARVRNLQKMMLRSWSNTLVSVRRVAQVNAGRDTAGIDGQVALTGEPRMSLARRVQAVNLRAWKPWPVRRVYIPKGSSGKLRPLGIPVLADRVLQARVARREEAVDTGRGLVQGVRQNPAPPSSGTARRIPRQGHDRRMVEGRGV